MAKFRGLGRVEYLYPDHAILSTKSEEVEHDFVNLPHSACTFVWNSVKTMRGLFKIDDAVYFEAVPLFEPKNNCSAEATAVFRTVKGIAKVKKVLRRFGYLQSEEYGDIFFPGSAVNEDFLGLHDLEKTLRAGDEVNYIAYEQQKTTAAAAKPPRRSDFKAVEIFIPPMTTEEPFWKHFGFVVSLVSSQEAVLFSKPLGGVLVSREDMDQSSDKPLEIGQRLKFSPIRLDPRLLACKWRATFARRCETSLKVPRQANKGFGTVAPLPPRPRIQLSSDWRGGEGEETFDDYWIDELEDELNSDNPPGFGSKSPIKEEPMPPLPVEQIDRVSLLEKRWVGIDVATQTDGGMQERKILERLLSDQEIVPLIVRKFPKTFHSLLS